MVGIPRYSSPEIVILRSLPRPVDSIYADIKVQSAKLHPVDSSGRLDTARAIVLCLLVPECARRPQCLDGRTACLV